MGEVEKNLRGKAVCYSRVSTKHDDQESSLEAQAQLFQHFLAENPGLICVGEYSDQESGKSTARKQFLEMLDRITKGDVDYILTKDSSRLSRSSEVSGALNRLCEANGCRILYVSNKQVFDPTNRSDRLINNIYTAVNEDYVLRQSEMGKIAHKLKVKNKRLSAQNEVYGYRFNKETGQMEIVEEEAEVIRLIFELYVFKNKGVQEISRNLEKLGIVGKKSGKRITARTISQRLECTAYMGKLAINKVASVLSTGVGAKNKKQYLPKEQWVYVAVPPIVSKELWELAQLVRLERAHVFSSDKAETKAEKRARFRGTHMFSSKVFCGQCGHSFQHGYHDRNKTIGIYKDSFAKKNTIPNLKCSNSYNKIFEDQLIEAVTTAINEFLGKYEEVFDSTFKLVNEVLKSGTAEKKECEFQKRLEAAEREKNKWLEAYKDAVSIGDVEIKEECLKSFKQASEKVEAIRNLINSNSERENVSKDLEVRLQQIKDRISKLHRIEPETLTREYVDLFVNRIEIMPDGVLHIVFTVSDAVDVQISTYDEYKETLKKRESPVLFFSFYSDVEAVFTDGLRIRITKDFQRLFEPGDIAIVSRLDGMEIPVSKITVAHSNEVISPKSISPFVKERKFNYTIILFLLV